MIIAALPPPQHLIEIGSIYQSILKPFKLVTGWKLFGLTHQCPASSLCKLLPGKFIHDNSYFILHIIKTSILIPPPTAQAGPARPDRTCFAYGNLWDVSPRWVPRVCYYLYIAKIISYYELCHYLLLIWKV